MGREEEGHHAQAKLIGERLKYASAKCSSCETITDIIQLGKCPVCKETMLVSLSEKEPKLTE